jgi:hypothetical protein
MKKKSEEIEIKTIGKNTKKSIVDFYNKNQLSEDRNIEDRIALNVQDYGNYLSRGKNRKKK